MSSDYNFHLDALNCLAATAGEIHETEKKTQGSKVDEENISEPSVKTTVEELESGGGDEKNEKSNMYTNLDSKVTGLEGQSYSSFLEEVRSSNPHGDDNIQELFDSVINSTSRASPGFPRNPFSVYQLKPPNFSLNNFLNKQNDNLPFSSSGASTPTVFKTSYGGNSESFLPPVFNDSFMKQPWQSQPLSSYTQADYQKLLESLPPEYQTTHNLVKNHLMNSNNSTNSGTNSLFSTLIEESQKILSSQEKKMQEKLHFQNAVMDEGIKTHLALLTKENEKILNDSKNEVPEKPFRKKASQKRSRTSDSKKSTGPPFNPPKAPPNHNSPESALCTFHEHTLLKMATRGFWSGDRGPFQDIFRLARVETMDLQFTVQDVTEHCYKLIRERIMTTDAGEDILKHHMKSYIAEFDEYLDRIFPVTLVAMNMYFPLASDYAQVTWHGVVPTGWSEYRRAVVIREVFSVLLYFMENEEELPPYDISFFEDTFQSDLLFPVPFPSWKPEKVPVEKDNNNNNNDTNSKSEVAVPADLDSAKNNVQLASQDEPELEKKVTEEVEKSDVQIKQENTPSDGENNVPDKTNTQPLNVEKTSVIAETPLKSENEKKGSDKELPQKTGDKEKGDDKSDTGNIEPSSEKQEELTNGSISDENIKKKVQIDKTKVKYSIQFKALWTRTSPKQPTVTLDDNSEISLGAYFEQYPIELHAPKGNVIVNIANKKYYAKLILGYFRRGVQLVDYSKSNGNLVDTTSTLKNISMASAIRKVPPGKISKLIHPELHLDNYTSSIVEIGAENADGSLPQLDISSKSRARKRKVKSQSEAANAKAKKPSKPRAEVNVKEEMKEVNTSMFTPSPITNEVFSNSSRDSFHTKLENKTDNHFPIDLPLPKTEVPNDEHATPTTVAQPSMFMTNLASPTATPRMPSVLPSGPSFPANSYGPDILSSMQFISSRGNTELFSLHIMIDSYRRAAKYLLDTANHLELVARRTYQPPATVTQPTSTTINNIPQPATVQPKKENKDD